MKMDLAALRFEEIKGRILVHVGLTRHQVTISDLIPWIFEGSGYGLWIDSSISALMCRRQAR